MSLSILDDAHIHPSIRDTIANDHADIVREVQAAVGGNNIVVVGMKRDPFPRKARKALDARGIPCRRPRPPESATTSVRSSPLPPPIDA